MATVVTRQRGKPCLAKKAQNDLTPTGLLMEGDSAQKRRIADRDTKSQSPAAAALEHSGNTRVDDYASTLAVLLDAVSLG